MSKMNVRWGDEMPGRKLLILISVLCLCSLPLFASQQQDYARLRHIEGEVQIYPSDTQRPSEAVINFPVLEGDQIETGSGRAEVTFQNGIVIRIGDYSAVTFDSMYTPLAVSLLGGTVFVDSQRIESFGEVLEVRAGDAQIYLIEEGSLRVDLGKEGGVRVTTFSGAAEVRSAGFRVLANAGERTYIDPGQGPERPQPFDNRGDELDDWNFARMDSFTDQGSYYGDSGSYVGGDLYYETQELSKYGYWRDYEDYGNVWVPYVGYGWRPYYDGRWIYSSSDWFWVSYEPWGWAPYHYGRWGWSLDFGWYWIPGRTFGPAWVSWYNYGNYIGWCPLNYYNYPVYYGHGGGHGGYHGGGYSPVYKEKTIGIEDSWTFVRKEEIGTPAVRRSVVPAQEVRNIPIETGRIITTPERQLVSYVMPTTRRLPQYVNDKRIVRQPDDIQNPVGVNHREELGRAVPQRDKSLPSGSSNRRNEVAAPRNQSRTIQSEPQRGNPYRGEATPSRRVVPSTGNRHSDRDEQFRRSDSRSGQSSTFVSPYFRERSDTRDSQTGSRFPGFRSAPDSYQDRYRERATEVSPRYLEEARRVFESFEGRGRIPPPDSKYSPQPTYSNPGRSSDRSSRSSTPQYRPSQSSRPQYQAPRSAPRHSTPRPQQKPNGQSKQKPQKKSRD